MVAILLILLLLILLIHLKTKITDQTNNDEEINGIDLMILLKYLSSFCITLEMPLINCEVELTFFT